MNAKGYVIRFCTNTSCPHDRSSVGQCPNPQVDKFYVDPDGIIEPLDGVPLVIAHDDAHIVGYCKEEQISDEGHLVTCVINDEFLVETMRRRFREYIKRYNRNIGDVGVLWKKMISSFSLSHEPRTGRVKHISLVDTPGRVGTAIKYSPDPSIVLIKRPENEFIADVLSAHTAHATNSWDRNDYLCRNTRHSFEPTDIGFICAERNMGDFDGLDGTIIDRVVDRLFSQFNQSSSNKGRQRKRPRFNGETEGAGRVSAEKDYAAGSDGQRLNKFARRDDEYDDDDGGRDATNGRTAARQDDAHTQSDAFEIMKELKKLNGTIDQIKQQQEIQQQKLEEAEKRNEEKEKDKQRATAEEVLRTLPIDRNASVEASRSTNTANRMGLAGSSSSGCIKEATTYNMTKDQLSNLVNILCPTNL
ncbi:hypothetical protein EGW08_021952 [Elysia chlorotica]|uniref:Uncharacterized protein n=1 Tax=Elysia chlorotica TaxID=188477 RepID=A0A3S1ART4_ELYCH|nr:hypothetical protein EGW08_021952 [Elysia chlorotica]